MQYRLDAKNGNKLSALGMGCMRLPGTLGNIDQAKAEAVVMEAIAQGINFFDTAYLYPGSEVALGKILAKHQVRDKVYVSTKLPLFKCHTYQDFDKYLNIQLERLQTDYIDYYFMHNMTRLEDWTRLVDLDIEKWLLEKKAQGKIKYVGFSYHGQRDGFVHILDAYPWDFTMIQYNYINVNYQAGVSGLKYAYDKGIPVFIMEPLLGGRLAKDLPEAAVKLFKAHHPDQNPAAWALQWLWHQPEVTLVLSGMGEVSQITENVAIAQKAGIGSMSEAELDVVAQVADVFAATYKIPCTGCNYCMPCPVKINIPDSFLAYNASYAISRFTGIQNYATTSGGFSPVFSVRDCIQCGKCEKECPQNIKIVAQLQTVAKRMEPWWYRGIMAVARRVMK